MNKLVFAAVLALPVFPDLSEYVGEADEPRAVLRRIKLSLICTGTAGCIMRHG